MLVQSRPDAFKAIIVRRCETRVLIFAPRRKKTAFWDSDGVRLEPTYSATEMSSDIEILHEANSDILFNKRKISFKRGLNYAIYTGIISFRQHKQIWLCG